MLLSRARRRWPDPARAGLAALLLLIPSAAACSSDSGGGGGDDGGGGGDGSGDGTEVDAGSGTPDGGGDSSDAGIEIQCPPGELGALGSLANPQAFQEPIDEADPEGPQARTVFGDVPDLGPVTIALVDDRGAFGAGGAAPGTYELGEAESSLSTCGICVQLGIVTEQAAFAFLPTAGSLALDSIDVALTGSITGLALQEMDPMTGDLRDGGCTATADSIDFDASLEPLEPIELP